MPNVKVRTDIAGPHAWLLYGDRFLANVPATVEFTPSPDDRDPLTVKVTMTIDVVDGRLACTSLSVEGLEGDGPPRSVSTDDLRRVPVASYVQIAGLEMGVLSELVKHAGGAVEPVDYTPPPADFAKAGMTDEALEQVSRIYAAAQATGQKPSGVLLAHYGMPRATSSRWLSVARRRGLLVEDHRKFKRGEADPAARAEYLKKLLQARE